MRLRRRRIAAVNEIRLTLLLALPLACGLPMPAAAAAPLQKIKSGEHYAIYAAAASGKLLLEIVSTDGWKLNRKAPLKLKIVSSDGRKPARELWTGKDARRWKDTLCRLEIPLQGKGPARLNLQLEFVICTDVLCQKKKFSFDYDLPSE